MKQLLPLGLILVFGGLVLVSAAPPSEAPASDTVGMIYIPGGTFVLGRDLEEGEVAQNDTPAHPVRLKPFWIDRYEVTNGQFEKFIAAKGYGDPESEEVPEYWSEAGRVWLEKSKRRLPRDWESLKQGLGEEFARHPVVGISWFEAEAYARFLGKRLPTEAEWERAARGTDGRLFPWGGKLETGLPVPKNRRSSTVPVGSVPIDVSASGCFDMGGNVSEWTASWYDGYPGTKFVSRYWGETAKKRWRVARGGSWYSLSRGIRSAELEWKATYRAFDLPPQVGYTFYGVRLAKDVAVTEGFALTQLSPPVDQHGTVRWPADSETVRFTYRVVPRRTGREGSWSVAEEDRVRGVVLFPPQSDLRGRLSPLDDTVILGDRLLAPEGWAARRAEWMGGEVLWYRAESGDLSAEGAVFGLELSRGEGWPNAFSAVYTCGVALTGDGKLPSEKNGGPAALHNLVGPAAGSNVVWFWFRSRRELPANGLSDPPPVSLPIGAKR